MSWFYNFEHDFDDLFHRPRRYTNKIPPNYNPRKITGAGYNRSRGGTSHDQQQVSRYEPSRGLLRTSDDFLMISGKISVLENILLDLMII